MDFPDLPRSHASPPLPRDYGIHHRNPRRVLWRRRQLSRRTGPAIDRHALELRGRHRSRAHRGQIDRRRPQASCAREHRFQARRDHGRRHGRRRGSGCPGHPGAQTPRKRQHRREHRLDRRLSFDLRVHGLGWRGHSRGASSRRQRLKPPSDSSPRKADQTAFGAHDCAHPAFSPRADGQPPDVRHREHFCLGHSRRRSVIGGIF